MILTWTTIQNSINISSILGIWTTNFLIPPTEAELMGGHIRMREGHEYLCLSAFPKENNTLTHYTISAWWLYHLERLVYYVQFLVMTNNITTLGYTYNKRRLKKPSYIFCKIAHTSRLIEWIP